MSVWWLAPALSTVVANVIDSYTFFAVAFNNSADEYMAANWIEIAGSQAVLKIAVGLIIVPTSLWVTTTLHQRT